MTTRHTLALLIALASVACTQEHTSGNTDGGSVPPVDGGGDGLCCPIDDTFAGCSPGLPGRASGGWAPSAAECASHTISGFDGRPFARQVDARGCAMLVEISGCCGCVDAGPPPTRCDGLAPAACLAAFCVPEFDDACCPTCGPSPGPCADCTRPTYLGCVPEETSSCRGGPECGTAPIWACGPAGADCSTAHAVALDTCDRVGCVPAYPGVMGEPDPAAAICVPITGASCTVACRRLPPPCPTGMVPEGDGSCYTDRCIPAFVCGSAVDV